MQTITKKGYSRKLANPKWQKKRLKILNRDKFTCKLCNDQDTELQVHHLKYTVDEPHLEPEINLITYCDDCHRLVESIKKIRIAEQKFKIGSLVKFKSPIGATYFIQDTEDRINYVVDTKLKTRFPSDGFRFMLKKFNKKSVNG